MEWKAWDASSRTYPSSLTDREWKLLEPLLPPVRLCPRVPLPALRRTAERLDFLSSTFLACGLPLALSADEHAFFFTHLGSALRFYELSPRCPCIWSARFCSAFIATPQSQSFHLPREKAAWIVAVL